MLVLRVGEAGLRACVDTAAGLSLRQEAVWAGWDADGMAILGA